MPLADPKQTAAAITLQGEFANLGAIETVYLAAPEAGYIKEILVARDAAGGAGESILTITMPAGAMTKTMTLATAGAAGDVDSQEFAREDTNNYVAAGEGFSIASDGVFGGTPGGKILVVMEAY